MKLIYLLFFNFSLLFHLTNCSASKLITKKNFDTVDKNNKMLDLAFEDINENKEKSNFVSNKNHKIKSKIIYDCTEILNKFLNITSNYNLEELNFANIELDNIEKKQEQQVINIFRVICIFGSKINFQNNVKKLYKIIDNLIDPNFINRSYENGDYAMKIGFFFNELDANSLLYKLENNNLKLKNCRVIKEIIPNNYEKIVNILNQELNSD